MEIDEVKIQETATTLATAATATSADAKIGAITDTNASHAEERSDDGQSDNRRSNGKRNPPKISKTSKALKGARSLTSEEKAVIISKAEEIGAAEASREFGINYYTIYTWLKQGKKKAPEQSSQSANPAAQTQEEASNQKPSKSRQKKETTKAAQVDEIKGSKREYIAKKMPTVLIEAVAPDKPVEAKELNKPSEVTTGKAVSTSPAQIDEKQALLIENAILRERISTQKAEIEKLQAAIKSLMV